MCCGYMFFFFFFFKQKTAYEIGTGDWSSDVCSSDLGLFSSAMAVARKIGTASRANSSAGAGLWKSARA